MTDVRDDASLISTLLDDVDVTPLLQPVELAGLRLRNRFAMAPMTRLKSPGGIPTDEVAAYYARRASSLGLMMTEGTFVDEPGASFSTRAPRFYGEDAFEGWQKVLDAVHAEGGLIAPQIWHTGSTRIANRGHHPEAPIVSPSGINAEGETVGEAADAATIERVVTAFAKAALDAKRMGFDAVEIHGAHGYLLDEFHWTQTNTRTDSYGGSMANRVRLSAEVVAAIRDAVGPDFPVIFRYSQWKGAYYNATMVDTPAELEEFLVPLADAGVSMFHVSTRRYWLPAFEGSEITLAGWTKKITGVPVIGLGSVGVGAPYLEEGSAQAEPSLSLKRLVELVETGEFDLVGLGRAILADPDFVRKLEAGTPEHIETYVKNRELELR